MIKTILFTATILFLLGASAPVYAQGKQVSANSSKRDLKFLDDISVEVSPMPTNAEPIAAHRSSRSETQPALKKELIAALEAGIEVADKLQFKYALLLDAEVEKLRNLNLLKVIDDWFGIPYRLGGSTKAGIDCSALMQIFFTSLYGVALPRTAKEQYQFSRKVSKTELKEGDLVFFNTKRGVSHVGMYLQNNKFVHASTSSGVMVSDLLEDYWVKRFIGAGRVDAIEDQEPLFSKP